MNTRLWMGLATGLLLSGLGVEAQEQGEMVVTATRTERDAATLGSSVTLIDRAQIEQSGYIYALDLLRTVPGVEVLQSGGPGKVTSVFLRGGASTHTLVLIDGIRVNSASSGLYDFADLVTADIEKIEVLRGSQSTLYGSEAIGGVISITTRKGGESVRDVSIEGGSLGLFGVRGSLRGGDTHHVQASASYEAWDGVSAASESAGNTEDDGYENTSASIRFGGPLAGGQYDIRIRAFESESDLDGFGLSGPEDAFDFIADRDALVASLGFTRDLSDTADWSLRVGLSDETLEGSDPVTDFNNYSIDSQLLDVDAQLNAALSDAHLFTAGYAFEERDGKNAGSFDESVDIHSVFVQDQWTLRERMYLTLGARFDDHSAFGDETTYRADYAWICPENIARVHASVGSGFRAPTLNDLYFPGYGNPDLEAETSVSWDIGYEHRFADGVVVVDVTYFASEVDDLIGYDASTFTAGNIDDAEIAGVEGSVAWSVNETCSLSVNHTYTDTEDKATGEALARRAKNRTSLTASSTAWENLTASLTVLAVSDRVDTDGSDMDDYERVDLALTYQLTELLTPYVRVQNLFDQDYEEVTGYTSPGIVAVGGVRATF